MIFHDFADSLSRLIAVVGRSIEVKIPGDSLGLDNEDVARVILRGRFLPLSAHAGGWSQRGLIKAYRVGPRRDRRFVRTEVEQLLISGLTDDE